MSLVTNITNLATRIATESKSIRTLLNNNASTNSALTTAAKSNLVAAINEINAKPTGGAAIDDASPSSTTTVYSASKTNNAISTAVSALVNGSSAALDTLKELADALGGDANFSTTVMTALGLRVRVDAAQSLTTAQQTQARSNISAAFTTDVGDTTTDFVATFNAGLV